MFRNYKERLNQYLIDLDEEFFCEYDDIELMQTTTIRKELEKEINKLSLIDRVRLQEADKKVFKYMEKYKDKPVYPVLENIEKVIKNSKLYKKEELEVV